MKAKQLIRTMLDNLRSSGMDLEESLDQVALLLTWQVLSNNRSEQIPLSDISRVRTRGQLRQSFDQMRQVLTEIGDPTEYYYQNPEILRLKESDLTELLDLLMAGRDLQLMDLSEALLDVSGDHKANYLSVLAPGLSDFMCSLGQVEGHTSYFPFGGSLRAAVRNLKHGRESAVEVSQYTMVVAAIGWMIRLSNDARIERSDPLFELPKMVTNGTLDKFQTVIMAPALGAHVEKLPADTYGRFFIKSKMSDVLAVQHGLAQCSGRMVVMVTPGFLFRSAHDRQLRKKLVDQGILDSVIQLPSRVIPNASVAPVLLVFDLNRNVSDPILFYEVKSLSDVKQKDLDASIDWNQISRTIMDRQESSVCTLVTLEQIRDHNYDLSINKYLQGEASKKISSMQDTVNLSEIAEIIRAVPLKEEGDDGMEFREVGAKDINEHGVIENTGKRISLSGLAVERAMRQQVHEDDILIATKGRVGVVGMVTEEPEENWVANQVYQIIRLRSDSPISSVYLYRYLSSPLIQKYLSELATGSSVEVIKHADLMELPVQILSANEQQKVHDVHRQIEIYFDQIDQVRLEIQKLKGQNWSLSDERGHNG